MENNIINESDIKNYIIKKLEKKNQLDLLNFIDIDNNIPFLGAYNKEEKRIILSIDNAITLAKKEFCIESNNFLKDDKVKINLYIMKLIDHELQHINQIYLINKQDLKSQLILKDLQAIKENFETYKINQNIFITEYNANFISYEMMIENAKKIKNVPYFNWKEIKKMQEYFIKLKNYYGAPYEQFNNKFNNKYKEDISKLTQREKIEYGIVKVKL